MTSTPTPWAPPARYETFTAPTGQTLAEFVAEHDWTQPVFVEATMSSPEREANAQWVVMVDRSLANRHSDVDAAIHAGLRRAARLRRDELITEGKTRSEAQKLVEDEFYDDLDILFDEIGHDKAGPAGVAVIYAAHSSDVEFVTLQGPDIAWQAELGAGTDDWNGIEITWVSGIIDRWNDGNPPADWLNEYIVRLTTSDGKTTEVQVEEIDHGRLYGHPIDPATGQPDKEKAVLPALSTIRSIEVQ